MAGPAVEGEGFTINLYPILDVFSILIVFLLMSFSTQGQSIESSANLELPKSEVRLSLDEAAAVSITKTEIVVQGQVEIPLDANGDVPARYIDQGAIRPAYEIFVKLADSMQTLKNRDQNLELTDADVRSLTLESDKQTSFRVIKRIMRSAQQAEFTSWKLAVDKVNMD
jgi:biopolymer transport protein ExbD